MADAPAKDLGVYGETFPIAEENLLTVIQNKLKTMEENGELEKVQRGLAGKAEQKIRHPSPLKNLTKTRTPRQWFYDPSLTIEKDIKDHKGHLIAAKGTVMNPLDTGCQLALKIDPLLALKIDPSTLFKKQTYRA